MRPNVRNGLLAAIFALLIVANLIVRIRPELPNFEYAPDMARSPAYKSYSASPEFADGKTLQAPAAGTIPRGYRPLHLKPTAEDAARAAEEMKRPIGPIPEQASTRGAAVFSNFCRPCHGPTGIGDGQVATHGFPAPPPLNTEKARALKDGQIFHIVTFGGKNMPGYVAQISEEDRWLVISHIRSLQNPPVIAQLK
ncbi:MAG: cytochrome c [Acidobacteria bacterium]|nr:cytochrome c [Acidobacteriota bacterium]